MTGKEKKEEETEKEEEMEKEPLADPVSAWFLLI